MLLNQDEIHRLAGEKEKENLRFRSFLKNSDAKKIDWLVHELYERIAGEIDCTLCGYCCTRLRPVVMESDIDLLVKLLGMSRKNFRKKYTITDEEGDMLFRHLPCKFLKGKKCTIYDSRPHDCRSYPHLHKAEITGRLYGILENYSICPIVFNVIEALKTELNFR